MHPRLFRLLEKHQSIDEALRLEQRRRSPDWSEILQLKRHKLRVKDLIHRFTRGAAGAWAEPAAAHRLGSTAQSPT